MNPVRVSTVLGTGQSIPFVRIEDADVMAKQAETSRPGAIVISVDGVEFMGPDLFDEIDTFWFTFIEGVERVRKTGSGSSLWSAQNIRVDYSAFDRAAGERFLHMRLVVGDDPVEGREAYAPLKDFSSAVADAATLFFEKAHLLDPDRFRKNSYYQDMIDRWRAEDA